MDFLTDPPATGPAPEDIVDRFLRFDGAVEVDPRGTLGHTRGKTAPVRVARTRTGAFPWPDTYDAFSDFGFRSHPATDEFPWVLNLCGVTPSGRAVVVTNCEGDLSISLHSTVDDACAWMGADADTDESRFAFQL